MARRNIMSEERDDAWSMDRPLSLWLLVRALKSLGPYLPVVVVGNILCLLMVWADMQIIHSVGELVDRKDIDSAPIVALVAPFLLYIVLNRLFGSSQWMVTNFATNRAMERLRKRFFVKLQGMSKAFFDLHRAGWLVARNTGDMQILHNFMTFSLMVVVMCLANIGFAFVRVGEMATALLLPSCVIAPVFALVVYIYKRRMARAQRAAREQHSRLVANLAETVRGIRVVHAFNREEENLAHYDELNRTSRDLELRVAHLNGIFLPSLDFLGILNLTLMVGLSFYLIETGYTTNAGTPLTPGVLTKYILYMQGILMPIRFLMEMYSLALAACVTSERIFEILDMEPQVRDREDAREAPPIRGRVRFEDTGFRYGEDAWVIRRLDLEIAPGETVAIVGETGAGKTTLASLIARFYDAEEGRVRIDDFDVRAVTQESLHRQMGIVLQQGYLFTGTVLENIRFARPAMTRAEAEELAKALGTHEAIAALPDGYETEAVEGGENLSLGQRQLVAITRALAGDPRILILDEPTSSLDIYTERVVQQALETVTRERTTVVIAHRLSTVRRADRILVLDQGVVVEEGTHAELIDRGGYYARLVRRSEESGEGIGVGEGEG